MEKKIIIEWDKNSKAKIEVEGAVGQECITLTDALERSQGTVENRELKDEYNQGEPIKVR
jgi:hypothetical protein